ncbi:MAG: hypothetical protein LBR07_02300, partial [Puniceicoccales bacterium]|nr:hypothetical protein [Puniceicoccales bacterium]
MLTISRRQFLENAAGAAGALALSSAGNAATGSTSAAGVPAITAPERIRSWCVDFNWLNGTYAPPGYWTNVADPAKHIAWHRDMNCNALSTFAVPFHGLAWFRSEVAPVNPGLKHDFLPEMVRLGERHGIKVFAYINVAANRFWSAQYPAESRRGAFVSRPTVALTSRYLDYLRRLVAEIFAKANPAGLHIDWLVSPMASGNATVQNGADTATAAGKAKAAKAAAAWLPCEREMWRELLGEKFPAGSAPSAADAAEFHKRAVVRAWKIIRETAKAARSDALLRFNCPHLENPQLRGTPIFRETDWLVGETGDIAGIRAIKQHAGPHTRLLTCLAEWNGKDPLKMLAAIDASGLDIG